MTDLRDVGTVADARFDDSQIEIREFVKVDFGSPVLRYTNKPGGLTADIDGSSETWTEFPLTIGPIQQGRDTALDVSWVRFADADGDNLWVGYLVDPGIRQIPCVIYRAHFSVVDGSLLGSYVLYDGEMDEGRDDGSGVRIVLVPSADRTLIPGRSFLPHMDEFLLMPRAGDIVTFGTKAIVLETTPTSTDHSDWVNPYSRFG